MGERNDLIERLRGTIADADSDIAGELLDAETPGEPFDPDDWQVEVPVGWLREAVGTIASLSEALAEAEKKGAEDWRPIETAKAGEFLLLFEPHSMGGFIFVGALNGVWFNNLDQKIQQPTMWRPLPAPPRDLSQGDQHG